MKSKLFLLIIFLLGLGIFSYPIVSNILANQKHYEVINNYENTISQVKKKKIQQEKEKAKNFNKKINASGGSGVTDPFSDKKEKKSDQDKSYYNALNLGKTIGILKIPKIDVNLPIYHGTEDKVLSSGVGHLSRTALPIGEKNTHSVLSSHRGLPSAELFRHLDQVKLGDFFYIQILDEKFAYKVKKIRRVLPNETDWITKDPNNSIVTLLTCDPYMINTHRLLVTGYLVNKEKITNTSSEKISTYKDHDFLWGIIILVFLLSAVVLYYLWKRKKKGKSREKV